MHAGGWGRFQVYSGCQSPTRTWVRLKSNSVIRRLTKQHSWLVPRSHQLVLRLGNGIYEACQGCHVRAVLLRHVESAAACGHLSVICWLLPGFQILWIYLSNARRVYLLRLIDLRYF